MRDNQQEKQPNEPELYTVRECAERLRVSPQSVRAWIKAGKVKAVRHGRSYHVFADEVERIMKEGV